MDDQQNILLLIFEWGWVPLVAVVAWIIRKLFKIEQDCAGESSEQGKDIAVQKTTIDGLRNEFDREMKVNAIAHKDIMDRLDAHNLRVMTRLDSLLRWTKNGGK